LVDVAAPAAGGGVIRELAAQLHAIGRRDRIARLMDAFTVAAAAARERQERDQNKRASSHCAILANAA